MKCVVVELGAATYTFSTLRYVYKQQQQQQQVNVTPRQYWITICHLKEYLFYTMETFAFTLINLFNLII